jgi:hypothetical protein
MKDTPSAAPSCRKVIYSDTPSSSLVWSTRATVPLPTEGSRGDRQNAYSTSGSK